MRDPEPWEAEYHAMQEQLMQHGKVRGGGRRPIDPALTTESTPQF